MNCINRTNSNNIKIITNILFIIIIFCFRFIKNNHLQKIMYVFILYFIGMFLVGVINEHRIFGEMIPFFIITIPNKKSRKFQNRKAEECASKKFHFFT